MGEKRDIRRGRRLYRVWAMRRILALTRRPALARLLSVLVSCCGVLMFAEGVLLGWLLEHVAPDWWEVELARGSAPFLGPVQWIAGISLLFVGIEGVVAGLAIDRRRPFGIYLVFLFIIEMLAFGAVLLYSGLRFDAAVFSAGGILNIGAGLLVAVLLVPCWYTLDPLGLHWDPSN